MRPLLSFMLVLAVANGCSDLERTAPPGDSHAAPDASLDASLDARFSDGAVTLPDATDSDVATVQDTGPPRDGTPEESDAPAPVLGEISASDLYAALTNKDFLLIDVHTPFAGVIPGTDARIAYTDIDAIVAYVGLDRDTKVVLTCLSGHMSSTAGAQLVALGYRHVSELSGGMASWTQAGYALDWDAGS